MGGLNKAFLATVGAVAITAEKSQQAVEDLVKKGELTVQQGKSLNQELSRKAKEAAQETTDGALRAFPTRTAPPMPPRSPRWRLTLRPPR